VVLVVVVVVVELPEFEDVLVWELEVLFVVLVELPVDDDPVEDDPVEVVVEDPPVTWTLKPTVVPCAYRSSMYEPPELGAVIV